MILQHKTYRTKRMEVTVSDWHKMQEIGASHKWTVIDSSDLVVTKVGIPAEIEAFLKEKPKKHKPKS